jgi:hypothetical protein
LGMTATYMRRDNRDMSLLVNQIGRLHDRFHNECQVFLEA